MMKQILFLSLGLMLFSACDTGSEKQKQFIDFAGIAPQLLSDGFVQLQATASSGLPVSYASWDPSVATIENDKAIFKKAGAIDIIAYQPGNEQYYEAPQVTQRLIIRDWDPAKKPQEIAFELPAEWKISRDDQQLKLNAKALSGLPVSYVLTSEKYGRFLNANTVYIYHAGEGSQMPAEERWSYNAYITIIASQDGNEEYNPADNVERTIRVIGDVAH